MSESAEPAAVDAALLPVRRRRSGGALPLAAYVVLMLVVFGVIAASGVVLLGSAGAIKAVAPKTEVGLKRENVPLPPVINPSPPPLERPTSMTQRTESSFASIGRPTGESGAVVAPPAQWETPMPRPGQSSSTLAAPGGATDSFVVLGAPSQPQ